MRILFNTVIILITINLLISAQRKESLWTQDEISNATVLLYQQTSDTTSKIGTGTIVYSNERYFLLTASHIAIILQNTSKIVFQLENNKPAIIDLHMLVKRPVFDWHHHPVADISLLEIFPNNDIIKKLLKDYSFPFKQIASFKKLPAKEADLTFLGYPMLDLDMEYFSPLVFNGNLASGLITQKRYDTNTKSSFFYLNVPSIEGCSGSGVYFSVKKGFYYGGKLTVLIGVVHGTKTDNTGGKLAAITPSYYIKDLLNDL